MTTSGITAFSLTVADHCAIALEDSAIIGGDEVMTAAELAKVIRRLNAMLKSWQMAGLEWKHETITVSVTANTAAVTLPTYVRGVNGARYVQSATNERQLQRFERDEYNVLPNKAASGLSTIYYLQRAEDTLVMYVWPVPTVTASLRLDIDRKMDTATSGTETLDIPEELTEAVYANLSVRCCGIFGKQPDAELFARAKELERAMLDNYRPASYIIEAA